ncbi:sulfhydryl oxidase 1 [Heptranchias perlo]|uniref:sulfhydryl oxidase 1 n=1 Tax=Heptranchias perlo TaxID=212740 RepID=UPI00355A19A2
MPDSSDMAQRSDAVLVSLAAISLLVTPAALTRAGLYTHADQVTLLDPDNFGGILYNSSNAWLVEFYASWCGHCIDFAPLWKSLASDIKEWKPALSLAAVNCANSKNAKMCRNFEVSTYPTIKFFKAFSKPFFKGVPYDDAGTNVSALRHDIIDYLEQHGENVWPPACPPLEPTSMAEVQNFFAANSVQYLALIFEDENSYLGREVTLDMLQYENIAVRRVLSSEENLMMMLGVQDVPSCYLYFANNTHRKVTVKMATRTFYTYYLRRLPGVTRGAYKLMVPDSTDGATMPPWRDFDGSKVYMADLESALYYSLKVEVGTHQELSGETLTALSHFITVLAKFFPGRPFVMKLLRNTEAWLADVGTAQISYNAYMDVLGNKKGVTGLSLSDGVNWVGCRGSRPQFRGYPCSLWTLFHVLTVQAAKYNESLALRGKSAQTDPLEVLHTLRRYVKHFFGCRECASHFEAMAAESMEQVDSLDKAILWLWSRHNRVNNRLAGALSEDPKFPKLQWPPPDMCAECHSEVNGEHVWITDAVLKFLKFHYSPENIDYNYLEGEQELLKKQKAKEEIPPDQGKDGPKEEEKEDEGGEEDEEEERNEEPPTRNDEQREIIKTITGIRRDGRQKRTFIKGKRTPRTEEDDIVDLDSFVNEQYKSQALKAKAENERASLVKEGNHGPQLHLQSIDDSDSLDYTALQERLQKRGIGSRYQAEPRKQNWLGLLGMSFSRTDISLCVLLYFLSSLCLLSMYLYFKMRFRWRKWKNGFASA